MATKICSGCGTEVETGSIYCPKCGGRLDLAAASGEIQPEPPAGGAAPGQGGTAPAGVQTPTQKLKERMTGGGTQGSPPAEGNQKNYVWRYAVRDMNVAWFGNAILTALILVVAFFIWGMVQVKVAEGVGRWFWLAIAVLCVLLWLWQFGKLIYRKTIRYRLTPSHFYNEEGIFRRDTNTMELWQISDIQHSQSLLEKLVCGGVGTIRLISDDPGDPILVLRGIVEHREAFALINEYRQRAREDRIFKRG